MNSVQDAVIAGDFECVNTLLSSSTPNELDVVNTPVDDEGTTLLHLAANCTSPSIMRLLVESDADVDWQNDDGLTALHVAAMWGRKEMVLLLLDYGASPSVYDVDGMLPVDYARKEDHKSCVKLLEEYLGSHNVDADHDVSVAETFVSLFADNLVKMSALHKPSPGDDDFFTQDNYAVQHGLLEMEQLYSQSDSVKCKDTTSPSILLEKSLDNAEGFLGYQSEGELYTTALDITSQSHNSADVSVPVQCIHTTATSEDEIVTVPEEIEELSNPMLRKELLALGEYPGPVTETTRTAYMMYLMKLRNGVQPAGNKGYKGYKYELSLVLNGTVPVPDLASLELHLTPSSSATKKSHRKLTKDCFNYLLLDPRVFKVSPDESVELNHFKEFVESIFYVGKGKNARSMQHLKEAKEGMMKNGKLSAKLACITNIWKEGHGILSLPVFHNMTEEESFSREACIIDAIGLQNLTNIQRGHVHGAVCIWSRSRRRLFGVYLLYKAFQIYKLATPQPLYPSDV